MRVILLRQIPITGFDPRVLLKSFRGAPAYIADWLRYRKLNPPPTLQIGLRYATPMLADRYANAGSASGHYFYQDLWAARNIYERRPAKHLDIGSRIDGFVAHLLTFMPVTIVDIRPLESNIQGLTFLQDDATKLSKLPSNSVHSLSSLHVAEHFGLGRYSDPIDPEACFRFMESLERVLAPGGRLYFSVPVGRERVEFNAHRVFSPKTILDRFSCLRLEQFSYVGDDDALYLDTSPDLMPASNFACGLFLFTKA
jgi:SAM-dependent methyltransferase